MAAERENAAEVVRVLMEVDRRKLFAAMGYHSLFDYCMRFLGYSEDESAKRIHAARAAERFPSIVTRLEEGKTSLTAINLVAPLLTAENHRSVLDAARGKTKREVQMIVARLDPKPEVAEVVRRLPETAQPRPEIKPLAPERIRFAFTGNEEFLARVDRCRQLLRRKFPSGDLGDIFAAAVEALLDREDPERQEAALHRASDPHARRIPRWVKQAVWKRDGGRCAFTATDGTKCLSREFLEFDHIVPWALGGPSNKPDNIRLLCRAHNQFLGRQRFGTPPSVGGRNVIK
ncbi:MAG: hypothetical protein A2X36_12700 [Elusimicrobia bacterium GWA2_69_24]|nr:MAG: hypothetical protein A2X36_12700 [Elusimicrobia bacterium GWA2_69_24]